MASVVGICNGALTKLGARRIADLEENSPEARACKERYPEVRDQLLRDHAWNFAVARHSLAANATAPAFGRANAFDLPATALLLIHPDPESDSVHRDWVVEGRQVLTDDDAPLEVRCVMQVTDPNVMDSAFRATLETLLAYELAETLTQSKTAKAQLWQEFQQRLARAKRANAKENVPGQPPEDAWLEARR